MVTLQVGDQKVGLVRSGDAGADSSPGSAAAATPNRDGVQAALDACVADPSSMSDLRLLLSNSLLSTPVYLLTDHQVIDQISSLIDTGSVAYQLADTPAGCCCCVESIDLSDFWFQRWDSGGVTMVGHFFQPLIKLTYTGSGACSSCALQWWEKTNVPYNLVPVPNQWTQITDPKGGPIEKWAQQVKQPCPGSETIKLLDPPSVAEKGRTVTRVLEFRIIVTCGAGCTCGKPLIRATARQTLVVVNGKCDEAKSKFETPNPADP